MLDLNFLPSNNHQKVKDIFTGLWDGSAPMPWIWTKPRGVSMAHILCIGAGGAGGGVAGGAGAKGGGGGGGGSAITSVIISVDFLPDRLYATVAASPIVGGVGLRSSVAISPLADVTMVNEIFAVSGTVEAQGGGQGTSSIGGAGGTGGTAATLSLMTLAGFGYTQFFAGQTGTAGGAITPTAGVTQTFPTTGSICMGGTGGGGASVSVAAAGGPITAISNSPLSDWRPSPGASGGGNGGVGPTIWKPFWGFCGCGGGSTIAASAGGSGGNGAYGSGGGGAAPSTGGGVNGTAGLGGPGLVIITCW